MSMYRIEIKNQAKKEIQSLPKKDQLRIIEALHLLQHNPLAGKKLAGEYEGARSLRIWPYRIIYTIYREVLTVVVLRVSHRKNVYR